MNTTETLKIIDIRERRRFFKLIGSALLFALIIVGIKFHDLAMTALFFGIVGFALAVGTLIVQLQGTLTSMELNNDKLILNYEYILSNRKRAKKIKLYTINDVSYSPFRTLVIIKCTKETLYVTVKDSEKTPVQSFIEVIKSKTIRRPL